MALLSWQGVITGLYLVCVCVCVSEETMVMEACRSFIKQMMAQPHPSHFLNFRRLARGLATKLKDKIPPKCSFLCV